MATNSQTKKSESYKAGFDCGLNGADLKNCNWSLFGTDEKLKEWEQGKADGLKAKAQQKKKRVRIVKRVKVRYR